MSSSVSIVLPFLDSPAGATVRSRAARAPTACQVAQLVVHPLADRMLEDKADLTELHGFGMNVAMTFTLTEAFLTMVCERTGEQLEEWIRQAKTSGSAKLGSFAKGLEKELAAVQAGLTEVRSHGQTEGQVHRLKLVKRQMYGRAGFEIL